MTDNNPFAHLQQALDSPRPPVEQPEPEVVGLPPVFQFSQQSLQDYANCPRRFQLRYIMGQRWPAATSEPLHEFETLMELGTQFHLLVQRHALGIPAENLTPAHPDLARWWDAYLANPPSNLPAQRHPETQLSIPVGDQRLLAKFDLLAIEPEERIVIVDWKTTKHRPARKNIARRLQSRVYPYILTEAGAALFGKSIEPEQVQLVYWFASDAINPEVFDYSAAQHAENHEYLTGLIEEIVKRDPIAEWPLTPNEDLCKYCVYRSLCNRGITAGLLDDSGAENIDFDFNFDFDLDEIDEIAF